MEAIPAKLRELVLDAYAAGLKTKEIVERYKVSPAWARRAKQHLRERGQRTALVQSKHGPDPKLDQDDRRRPIQGGHRGDRAGRGGDRHREDQEHQPAPAPPDGLEPLDLGAARRGPERRRGLGCSRRRVQGRSGAPDRPLNPASFIL